MKIHEFLQRPEQWTQGTYRRDKEGNPIYSESEPGKESLFGSDDPRICSRPRQKKAAKNTKRYERKSYTNYAHSVSVV